MMNTITTINELKKLRATLSAENKKVGFVPTMGALHAGHVSLFQKSVSENDVTIVSVYVNKTQFNDPADYENYPRDINKDIALLQNNGVGILFLPTYEEIYADNYNYRITENTLSKILCGNSRKGHFEGVLTVVLKLLNIVSPSKAYFGEKDYQQYLLIKNMSKAFFLDAKITKCPTVREHDGLALSSRNLLLTIEERKTAPNFYKILRLEKNIMEAKAKLEKLGFVIDYIEDFEQRRFGAVYLGKVRLIDNVQL